MQDPLSLRAAERRVFQLTLADGLWDVLIGCFVLEFSLAPLLSVPLGDFWAAAIFLPFWALAYLAIRLVRKQVVAPRIGAVRLGAPRRRTLRQFSLLMIGLNLVALAFGVLEVLSISQAGGRGLAGQLNLLLGLLALTGFSAAAYVLGYPRLYVYGLLLFAAAPVGSWLHANAGAAHHGYPVVYGFVAGVMIVSGLITFARLVRDNPVVDQAEA
jgi:hypothetical protein